MDKETDIVCPCCDEPGYTQINCPFCKEEGCGAYPPAYWLPSEVVDDINAYCLTLIKANNFQAESDVHQARLDGIIDGLEAIRRYIGKVEEDEK